MDHESSCAKHSEVYSARLSPIMEAHIFFLLRLSQIELKIML